MSIVTLVIGAVLGFLFNKELEKERARHQLRMAALDKRLQAHQEAYTHWVSLMTNLKKSEFADTYKDCREWWVKNCIYLSPKARNEFIKAINRATMLDALEQNPSQNAELIKETYLILHGLGEVIEKAA